MQLGTGIDPSVCDSTGYTALHFACRHGKKNACTVLLEKGANPNAQTRDGVTPLHRAAFQGHTGIVLLLLKYNADVALCDSDGKTALHKAVEGSHLNVAKILLDCKPELKSMRDNRGYLPVFFADPECHELMNLLSV